MSENKDTTNSNTVSDNKKKAFKEGNMDNTSKITENDNNKIIGEQEEKLDEPKVKKQN